MQNTKQFGNFGQNSQLQTMSQDYNIQNPYGGYPGMLTLGDLESLLQQDLGGGGALV